VVRQRIVHAEVGGVVWRRLGFAAVQFTRRPCTFARQPIHLCTLGALARGPQCHVDAVELDVDQFAARTNPLQLQIAVLADEVLQVSPESGLAIHGSHRDGCIIGSKDGAFFDEDHFRVSGDVELLAGINGTGVRFLNDDPLRTDRDSIRPLSDGAAPVKSGASRGGGRIKCILVDQARVERALELIEAGARCLHHGIGTVIGGLEASAQPHGSSRRPRPDYRTLLPVQPAAKA
jgi:hypothetical protein